MQAERFNQWKAAIIAEKDSATASLKRSIEYLSGLVVDAITEAGNPDADREAGQQQLTGIPTVRTED